MPNSTLTQGSLLARNTIWNLIGQGAPLLVAIFAIPLLIRALGTPRFGILTLAQMVVGYFSLFDLGLGRALTKLVAEKLGAGKESEVPALVWTALALMALLGVAGIAVVAALSPWLVYRLLKIPVVLQLEALKAFYLRTVSIPIIGTAGLPRERIQVIYNPVLTPQIPSMAAMPLDHPWFAPGEPPVILGAGRLRMEKGFASLIRAFARLRTQRPVRLVILGEGKERAALEALVQELGVESVVSLPGFVENPFTYMSKATMFVISSVWEGFGNVLVEAMACGTPVVSTDCPSGPSEILEYGRYGPLVPVGDIEELAEAIGLTLENPLDAGTLQTRAGNFSIDNIPDQYLEILHGSR